MEYKAIYYPQRQKRKVLLLPGWNSPVPQYLINKLKSAYELLVIFFPGSFFEIPLTAEMNIADYITLYRQALSDYSFDPDIRIGHSFGGKILSFIPDSSLTILVSPSSFQPLFREKILIKYKILRNRLAKRIFLRLGKSRPSKYLGSTDYQNSTGLQRATFLNVKDAYPQSEWKDFIRRKLIIIAYKNDRQIPIRRLKKGAARFHLFPPIVLAGNHYSVLEDVEPLLYIVEHNYGN